MPLDLDRRQVFGAGLLGISGFTVSIIITNLAFAGNANGINSSKMTLLSSSHTTGAAGFF